MRRVSGICLIGLVVSLTFGLATASDAPSGEYHEYTAPPARVNFFKLIYNSEKLQVIVNEDSLHPMTKEFSMKEMIPQGNRVMGGSKVLFDSLGLHCGDSLLAYSDIRDIEISQTDHGTQIRFFRPSAGQAKSSSIRRGNRITFRDSISVYEKDFARGAVFSVMGDITVAGEVNRDVVSLFGHVYVAPSGVVRGDLATIKGSVTIARKAQVYGDTYRGEEKWAALKHRFIRSDDPFQPNGRLSYNRVDGFAMYVSCAYHDQDSLLPSANVEAGYAFASKRWRFKLGVEQLIWKKRSLWVGADYYRSLLSDDDWQLPDWENSVYAILVKEDFKDFYEATGGSLYFRSVPVPHLAAEVRYRNEQTNWLNARRELWGLFGGDKQFPENFASAPSTFRETSISEIDTGATVTLSASVTYDTRKQDSLFTISAWRTSGMLDWSSTDFNSDYSYRRYMIDLRRYQSVTKYSMVLMRGMIGGSDGYVPMHHRFWLGGPGSLYGLERKEGMGTRFWMVNAEYRFAFPKTDLALGLFLDVAQLANDQKLSGDVPTVSSLGFAAYIGKNLRVSIARRLDRSTDVSPKIYVRLIPAF